MRRWFFLALALLIASPAFAGLKSGQAAPDFTLKTYDGKSIALSSLKGKTVVVAFWWSNTDEPAKFLRFLEGVHKQYAPRGVTVVAVNYDRSRGWGYRIWQKEKLSFICVHDADNRVSDAWHVRTHQAVVLDSSLRVVRVVRRATRELKKVLDAELAKK